MKKAIYWISGFIVGYLAGFFVRGCLEDANRSDDDVEMIEPDPGWINEYMEDDDLD